MGRSAQLLVSTQGPAERNPTRFRSLKCSWETVLPLNVRNTRKKGQTKPEGCSSKEGTGWCEKQQKQQAVTRLMARACNWPFLLSQDHIKIGLVGTYPRLLKAKQKLRKKKAVIPWDISTAGFQCFSDKDKKTAAEPKVGSPELQSNILTAVIFCPWTKGNQQPKTECLELS